jgi:hypothetical protein
MRTSRRLLISALTVVVLTVAAVPLLNFTVYTPARAAEAYISAIEKAMRRVPSPTCRHRLRRRPWRSATRSSRRLPTCRATPRRRPSPSTATMRRSASAITSPRKEQTVDLNMVRLPASAGLFDRWAIEQQEWPTLSLDVSGSSTATVNGYGVSTGECARAVPGELPRRFRCDVSEVASPNAPR